MMKVAQGDREAFETLYERHKRAVLSYTTAWVKNRAQAEEITQETFLRVYRSRESYQPQEKFTPWLWTIARNLCLDVLRKKTEIAVGEELPEPPAEAMPEAEARLVQQAEKKQLEHCLEELTAAQKDVLTLRTFSEMSLDEIVSATSHSLSAVKSLLHRAKQQLLGCLEAKGVR